MTATLQWHKSSDGTYVALVPEYRDPTVSRTWHVFRSSKREWVIESVTITRQHVPHAAALPPISVDAVRHGTAYTLRQAKEHCASFTAGTYL